ncbi:MAG: MaoC family dehydratase N-terminal domain-containing protein [Candidatus Eremiobacteraeota bacterium]|nr:MaoC family dehydratase N-terminal domain-containing protein [Candidatus Eremiobacteraeota bacterium]MBV9409946.1 MaoC family dehydratase N-terminal domain-containing protein [Candidatus Eremiobacteraeota bacterium]
MPRFYEDLAVGDEITTPARTITETDVVQFAQLTGDWNPIHTDAEFAKNTVYGQRLAHGLLGLAFAVGLLDRTGAFSGSVIANLGIVDWKYPKPLFIGDTIRVAVTITEKRLTSDGKRGIVGRRFTVRNQRDEVVQEGSSPVMIRLRPA